jgi:hypothetical protein
MVWFVKLQAVACSFFDLSRSFNLSAISASRCIYTWCSNLGKIRDAAALKKTSGTTGISYIVIMFIPKQAF